MKAVLFATCLLAFACGSPGQQPAPARPHEHLARARSQITPIYAAHETMAEAVASAVAAQSLEVVKTEGGEGWGRVTAVDAHGFNYVLSWEPSTVPSGDASGPCVLLFVSCDPGDGAVPVGQLAQAVRKAAEPQG